MAQTQENVSGWVSYKVIFWWLFQSNRFVVLIKIKGWKTYLQGVSESLMLSPEFYLEHPRSALHEHLPAAGAASIGLET